MEFAILPGPGTVLGPCRTVCEHKYCIRTRTIAATPCSFCEKPIGYGVRYYDEDDGLAHATCLEPVVEGKTLAMANDLVWSRPC